MKKFLLFLMLIPSEVALACPYAVASETIMNDAKKIGEKNHLMRLIDDQEK